MHEKLHIRARTEQGSIEKDDCQRLSAVIAPLVEQLPWGGAGFALPPEAEEEQLRIELPLDPTDRRRAWRDLCQGVGLSLVLSRLRPAWVFEIEDDAGLLAASLPAARPLLLKEGSVARPRRQGPPAPASDIDEALRRLLIQVLGLDLDRLGLVVPPPETPPEPLGAAVVQSGVEMRAASVRLQPATDGEAATGWLCLSLDIVNHESLLFQEGEVVVILRDGQGLAFGAAELGFKMLGPKERRQLELREALVHAPARIRRVDLQLRVEAVQQLQGESPIGWEEP